MQLISLIWIVFVLKCLKKLQCNVQNIPHNEFLAHVLDLLCNLLNYGYYGDYEEVDEALDLLINLLDGESDSPGQDKSGKLIIIAYILQL